MITVTPRALDRLGEELVQKCLDAGIGFRLLANLDKDGKTHPVLRFDRKRDGDSVVDGIKVKVFMAEADAAALRDFRLEWVDNPNGGWFLVMKDAKLGITEYVKKDKEGGA